jgi:hypothetical protein
VHRGDGLPISTAFFESAVNEILSKRMIKKQQMRWNRRTVQPFGVRIAVLNGTLAGSFRRPFRADNDNHLALSRRDAPHGYKLENRALHPRDFANHLRLVRGCVEGKMSGARRNRV